MTARLGDDAVAATATGTTNSYALAILPMGIVFIVQSFASQLSGKGDLIAARRYAWYALILAALTAAIGIAAIPLVSPALSLLPYSDSTHFLMAQYIEIRLFAIGPVIGMEALGNWFSGLGNTRIQMHAAIIAMIANVGLNWILIFGKLGAPALGVQGAAIASTIATFAGFGYLALAFWRRWFIPMPRVPLNLKRSEFVRMLRFGIPSGFNWFLEFGAFTVFLNLVVPQLGESIHAAMMVVIAINSVSFMPAFGLTSAGAILAGKAIGSREPDLVSKVLRRTTIVTCLWQGTVGMAYLLIPATLMSLFDAGDKTSREFLQAGAVMLAISTAWQLFDAVAMSVSETLRAAGDTAWPLGLRLALAWFVFVPGSYLSVITFDGGYIWAMIWLVIYLALSAIGLTWRFLSGAWRKIELTEQGLPAENLPTMVVVGD